MWSNKNNKTSLKIIFGYFKFRIDRKQSFTRRKRATTHLFSKFTYLPYFLLRHFPLESKSITNTPWICKYRHWQVPLTCCSLKHCTEHKHRFMCQKRISKNTKWKLWQLFLLLCNNQWLKVIFFQFSFRHFLFVWLFKGGLMFSLAWRGNNEDFLPQLLPPGYWYCSYKVLY